MSAALDFFKKLGDGALQEDAFKEAAGVGVEVPLADIEAAVAAEIEKHRDALLTDRCVIMMVLTCQTCMSHVVYAGTTTTRAH